MLWSPELLRLAPLDVTLRNYELYYPRFVIGLLSNSFVKKSMRSTKTQYELWNYQSVGPVWVERCTAQHTSGLLPCIIMAALFGGFGYRVQCGDFCTQKMFVAIAHANPI